MWRGLGQDPGGSSGLGPPNNQELDDLKDQFEQQQLLIAQLKEMLRKNEQVNVTEEKVEEYANTLTKMKARAKKNKKESRDMQSAGKILETPAKETLDKLRQQMEENKMKLAERDKSQRGIEEMVSQLKLQFDASQTLISQTPLNLSFVEVDVTDYTPEMTSEELYSILTSKERKLTDMTAKIQKLEANVLDLQENIKEKDSVIDARTKAITLMSENLSRKGKTTLDALDETKLQMRTMQQNFVEMEQQMNDEIQQLKRDVTDKDIEISHLNDRNNYLEHIRKELTSSNTELQDKLDSQLELVEAFQKGDSVIEKLQETIKRLEEENRKDAVDGTQISDFNNKIVQLENVVIEKEKQNQLIQKEMEILEEKLKSKSFFDMEFKSDDDLSKLKKQLDESNKNMIKVKAQHKSKLKEMTKKVDSFKRMGDLNAEVLKLQDENSKLCHKIAELEEEKGTLQLKMMETSGGKDNLSLEAANELERQLTELSEILTYKDNQILTLTQSFEKSEAKLKELDEKLESLSHLENVQVKSEITSIHLEEQLDNMELEKKSLVEEKEKLLEENKMLEEKIDAITKEKQEITTKLDTYIQENIELMDKLEKLSAEKVSSAESIEIVEGLTQQEKLELEAYQKNTNIPSDTKSSAEHLAENLELNESVNQLTEETSELLQRIELFTIERREVMEKMEQLTNENNQLKDRIKEIENNRDVLVETYEQLQTEKEGLYMTLQSVEKEKLDIETIMIELKNENELIKKNLKEKSPERKPSKKKRNQKSPDDTREDTELLARNNELIKEIEEYKLLIDIQKQEIQELKVQIMGDEFIKDEKIGLEAKMSSLQMEYQSILEENDNLRKQLKEDSEKVQEKDNIEKELRDAKEKIAEFEKKISSNLDEIENYKSIFEENKSELISSSNQLIDLHNELEIKENELKSYTQEIRHLNSVISDLNSAVKQLELENQKTALFDNMSKQVTELKDVLKSNIDQINEYEDELNRNTKVVNELQNEIKLLTNKMLETEHLLDSKNDEIAILKRTSEENQVEIITLQEEIEFKNRNFHETIEELRRKCVVLQNQISTNTDSMEPLEVKIKELEDRNKELEDRNKDQLEKMKKIAANLKKKTTQYHELEQKYMEIHEKWENELKEKDVQIENENNKLKLESTIENLEKDLWDLQEKMNVKSNEYNKLTGEFNLLKQSGHERNNEFSQQISDYHQQIDNLQSLVKDYEEKLSRVSHDTTELVKKDTLIHKLTQKAKSFKQQVQNLSRDNEELKSVIETQKGKVEIQVNASQMKIQELEMVIETQDADISKYKEKINKLENGLHSVEERRMSLERKATVLGAELEEKSTRYEELSQSEDVLEKRIESLMKHDEVIERRLQEAIEENEFLNKMHKDLISENGELCANLKSLQQRFNEVRNNNEHLVILENENVQLKQMIANLENSKKHVTNEYEQQIFIMKQDTERNELELQSQIEFYNNDHKVLTEKCEMLCDQINELQEYQNTLSSDIDLYKNKLIEQQQCLEDNQQKYEMLQSEFNTKLGDIKKLTENNNKQEDNIKHLEIEALKHGEEISNLRYIIDERNKQLETYQEENSQLIIRLTNFEAGNVLNIQEKDKLSSQLMETMNSYEILASSYQELQKKISETEKREATENIGTFTWPNSSNNDLISSRNIDALGAPPSKQNEELLSKVKSLEFMLYTTEKEKEETLKQCEALSGELAKLLYFQESEKHLESQIISIDDTAMTSKDVSELRSIEFEPVKEKCDSVVEEEFHAKSAYLCYPENPAVDTFGENDDGWGWSPEEVKLEQEHLQNLEMVPHNEQFRSQIVALEEKIRVLEQARERHSEEIRQSQQKSGKLIKKLKEFKLKNEELAAQVNKKSDDFDDLNIAIEDELKSQIKNLEKRIKDVNVELEKEKHEKGNLVKRVDVLTAANDRLVDTKEKQEIEIISWQQKMRDLNAKLEQFEWGDGGFETPVHTPKKIPETNSSDIENLKVQISELTETIKDLTLDNEELQALLEEQRNMRIAADKAKSVEPIPENMKTEAEYMSVVTKMINLNKELEELQSLKENLHSLQVEKESLQSINCELEGKYSNVFSEKNELQESLLKSNEIIKELQEILKQSKTETSDTYNQITQENNYCKEEIERKHLVITELENRLTTLQNDYDNYKTQNAELHSDLTQKQHNEKETLTKQNDHLTSQLQDTTGKLTEISDLIAKNEGELVSLREKLRLQDVEYENKILVTTQQLAEEWMRKVDQRGYDIAESWKLHVEERENEFYQTEQTLRKEIAELEEKHNILVNENNELRKNVDAEIRNEVDRISALQAQINEKQYCVNELGVEIEKQKDEINKYCSTIDELNKVLFEKDERLKQSENLQLEMEKLKDEIGNKERICGELEVSLSDKNRVLQQNDVVVQEKENLINEKERIIIEIKQSFESKISDFEKESQQRLNEKEQVIFDLNQDIDESQTKLTEKEDIIKQLNQRIENYYTQNSQSNENLNELQQQVYDNEQQLRAANIQLQQYYQQIEILNGEVQKYSTMNEEFILKDHEITKLNALLNEKEREYIQIISSKQQENSNVIQELTTENDSLKRRLGNLETHYDEVLSSKDMDIESYKIQLQDQVNRNTDLLKEKEEHGKVTMELALRNAECDEMRNKLDEQNRLLEEEQKQLDELKKIIEDQVLKIQDLQKELYEKSRNYDALIAEVDLSHQPVVQKSDSETRTTLSDSDDLTEPVSRAELDLALYMLHQRDVRCEELTVELMQLLEERDTLQLKLSNALREREQLRTKFDQSDTSVSESSSTGAIPKPDSPGKDMLDVSRSAEGEGVYHLDTKLSELKMLSYRKDKTLIDEQELRRLQQLSIMQQHRDEASKLPPEAAARLVDASYTLSRDVQSPSKVLLNWLWGRSTPKVNDI